MTITEIRVLKAVRSLSRETVIISAFVCPVLRMLPEEPGGQCRQSRHLSPAFLLNLTYSRVGHWTLDDLIL